MSTKRTPQIETLSKTDMATVCGGEGSWVPSWLQTAGNTFNCGMDLTYGTMWLNPKSRCAPR